MWFGWAYKLVTNKEAKIMWDLNVGMWSNVILVQGSRLDIFMYFSFSQSLYDTIQELEMVSTPVHKTGRDINREDVHNNVEYDGDNAAWIIICVLPKHFTINDNNTVMFKITAICFFFN